MAERPRLLWCLLFAGWCVGHLLLAYVAATFTYAHVGSDSVVSYPGLQEVYQELSSNTIEAGAPLPSHLSQFLALAFALIALFSWAFASAGSALFRCLHLTALFGATRTALAWSVRSYVCSGLVAMPVALLWVIDVAVPAGGQSVAFFILATVSVLVPLAILDAATLRQDRLRASQRLRWPPWQSLMFYPVGIAISALMAAALSSLTRFGTIMVALSGVIEYLADVFIYGALLSLLIHRTTISDLIPAVKARWTWRFLAVWLLLHLRFLLIALWFAPTAALVMFTSVWVMPAVVSIGRASGQAQSLWLRLFIACIDTFVANWYIWALALIVPWILICAKLLVLFDDREAAAPVG